MNPVSIQVLTEVSQAWLILFYPFSLPLIICLAIYKDKIFTFKPINQ